MGGPLTSSPKASRHAHPRASSSSSGGPSTSSSSAWWWSMEDRMGQTLVNIFSTCSAESASDCSPLTALTDKQWFRVVVLCCAVAIINSVDRTAMSIAILPMSRQHGWSDTVKGAVSSAFNVGHTLSNFFVGGVLARGRVTPKTVLNWGVVTWSLFTMLTPVAAAWLPVLLVVRALMGLGEGVAFPTMQAIIKAWVPPEKKSRCLSLIFSGHQIGSILSLLFSPLIISATGTTSLFYFYGALGFVWLAIWDPLVSHHAPKPPLPSTADSHGSYDDQGKPGGGAAVGSATQAPNVIVTRGLSSLPGSPYPGSTAHNGAGASSTGGTSEALPWRLFLSNRCFWALLVTHSVFGIGYSMFIAWLPTYYNQAFKVDLRQSSWLSILPFLMMAIGTNLSGWLADTLINSKTMTPTKARKLLQTVGNLGPGVCLMYLALVPQKGFLAEAVMLVTVSMMTLGMQAGGFASTHTDISTKYASALFGITNAGASLAGLVFVYLVGVILDATGSWSMVFMLVAICNFASAAVYVLMATSEPQFE